jgi:hypothetical protein
VEVDHRDVAPALQELSAMACRVRLDQLGPPPPKNMPSGWLYWPAETARK